MGKVILIIMCVVHSDKSKKKEELFPNKLGFLMRKL